tara:strand:+ start:11330 stop:11581 length:252 start_codon:yes stop_codon:yes gene_type:complete
MNEYSIRLVKPHCPTCHKYKDDTSAFEKAGLFTDVKLPNLIARREVSAPSSNLSLKDRLLASIGQSLAENNQSIANESEDELL